VEVAGLGKCSYLVGKRKVFIKDDAQIASRVCGAERAVLYLGKLLFESDEKKFSFTGVESYRLAVIQEKISCKAVWSLEMLD